MKFVQSRTHEEDITGHAVLAQDAFPALTLEQLQPTREQESLDFWTDFAAKYADCAVFNDGIGFHPLPDQKNEESE